SLSHLWLSQAGALVSPLVPRQVDHRGNKRTLAPIPHDKDNRPSDALHDLRGQECNDLLRRTMDDTAVRFTPRIQVLNGTCRRRAVRVAHFFASAFFDAGCSSCSSSP